MFYVLVIVSGLPGIQVIHEAHSVPQDIARDTLSDVKRYLDECRREHGRWGFTGPSRIKWLAIHFHGEIYRLGRLQFQFAAFPYKLRAFRHRTSGTVTAFSEGGVRYLSDGQLDGEGRTDTEREVWTSEFDLKDDEIMGHPIMATGEVLQRKVHLPAAEWREVLSPGDPILNIHIPDGSPMAFDLCGESFRSALEFFPRHFSERPFVGFCCNSWILDAELEEMLPPSSNLVRLQQEVYLFPTITDDLCLLGAVFHGVPEDLSKAPRDTTLQRAVLDRAADSSLHAKAGGCFLLTEDFDWGTQVYRRQEFSW